MKVLLLLVLCSLVCSPSSAEVAEKEPSTPNSGFFGYFGNLWKKQTSIPSRTLASVETPTSEQPAAGLFGHVKNWMNGLRKMSTASPSMNSTSKTLGTTSIRYYRPTTRITTRSTVSLQNISSLSTRNIKRLADTKILDITEPPVQFSGSSDTIASKSDSRSSEEIVEAETDEKVASAGENISSSTTSTIEASTTITTLSTIAIPTTKSNSSIFKFESNVEFKPFVYLDKMNRSISLPSSNTEKIIPSDFDTFSESTIQQNENHTTTAVTKKKRSNINKLTPLCFEFYNADDLNSGNSSKREVQFSPVTLLRNYTRKTKKIRVSRMSKGPRNTRTKKIKSTSTTKSVSESDLSDSSFD